MTILFVVLAAALATAAAGAALNVLQGWRARRLAARELERAEWRLWISRPELGAGQ